MVHSRARLQPLGERVRRVDGSVHLEGGDLAVVLTLKFFCRDNMTASMACTSGTRVLSMHIPLRSREALTLLLKILVPPGPAVNASVSFTLLDFSSLSSRPPSAAESVLCIDRMIEYHLALL